MRSNWCVLMLLGLNLIWVGMGVSGKSTLVIGTHGWVWSGCIVRSLFGMRILWSGIGVSGGSMLIMGTAGLPRTTRKSCWATKSKVNLNWTTCASAKFSRLDQCYTFQSRVLFMKYQKRV